MIEGLIEIFPPTVKLLIDISGIKRGEPISAEAGLVMDKQGKLISSFDEVKSLGINLLNLNLEEHLPEDKRFHRPMLIECPLIKLKLVEIFIKRKLEDLGIENYKIIKEV